jgi:hypothetical protein
MKARRIVCWMLAGTLAMLTPTAVGHSAENAKRAAWMAAAKYGVFIHFLGGGPKWSQRVEAFDVEAFAAEMERAGAAYVFISLGQNSGYYCSPNSVYEKYVGCGAAERCSRRDLPMDLAGALSKRKIRLLLYLPSRSPQRDPQAMKGLSDVDQMQPAPQEFTRKWSEVIRQWSERYGDRISGWWFDGAYNPAGWEDLNQPCNWKTWADACRAGNPQSILAFNPGTKLTRAFHAMTDQEDYTAGEQNQLKATPQKNPSPKGVQWHVLTYLGSGWGKANPASPTRFSDKEIIEYIRTVNQQGGAVTLDVAHACGKVNPGHLKQLIAIKRAIRGEWVMGEPIRSAL